MSIWKLIIALITAVVPSVWALWKYFHARRAELAWKRTEFLFSQAEKLDADPEMRRAIRILAGADRTTIADLFGPSSQTTPAAFSRESIDKLLNLLDRIAYATLHAKSLSMQEVANFGWYYKQVQCHPCLMAYCESQGYPDVARLASKIQKHMSDNYESYELSKVQECPHYGACAAHVAAEGSNHILYRRIS